MFCRRCRRNCRGRAQGRLLRAWTGRSMIPREPSCPITSATPWTHSGTRRRTEFPKPSLPTRKSVTVEETRRPSPGIVLAHGAVPPSCALPGQRSRTGCAGLDGEGPRTVPERRGRRNADGFRPRGARHRCRRRRRSRIAVVISSGDEPGPGAGMFYPQLPWFKELEGAPGYAQLVDELRRRQTRIRADMTALDSALGPKARLPNNKLRFLT